MVDQKRRKANTEIKKTEYLENVKSFLDEIKSFFNNYLRAAI